MSKILIVILLTAALLRFYKLSSFPVSIYWDEAAIGYNAYSIAQTARDEYGTKLPLLFKSFNDYKLPGYIYADSLLVKLFGLSIFTTRLPSALFGTFAVLAIYLIARQLFLVETLEKSNVPTIAALLLTISPWHLQFSRVALEATIAFSIILFGTFFLLYGRRHKIWAFLAIPALSISLYFYLSARLFVPLIIIAFFLIYRKEINKNLSSYLNGLLLAVIISAPIIASSLSYAGLKHVKEVSIFEDKSFLVDYFLARGASQSIPSKIFLNYRSPYIFESLHKYFSHLSFGFLFFGDDPNPRHHSAFHGNLYLFEIPLLLIGLWQLTKFRSNTKYFLLSWLLIAPFPASISQEAPHSLRSMQMLLPLTISSAAGLVYLTKSSAYLAKSSAYLTKTLRMRIIISIITVIFFMNYLFSYYLIYPLRDSMPWGYGYQQMYQSLSKLDHDYDKVIVTGYYWKPYIYYLYINKIGPNIFQSNPNIESIGKYRFGTTYWDSGGQNLTDAQIDKLKGEKTLLVLSPQELQDIKDKNRFQLLQSIHDYSNRNTVFEIGEWQ